MSYANPLLPTTPNATCANFKLSNFDSPLNTFRFGTKHISSFLLFNGLPTLSRALWLLMPTVSLLIPKITKLVLVLAKDTIAQVYVALRLFHLMAEEMMATLKP